jgi:hypothetical protein
MKTHSALVYHCIACGRVEHTPLDAPPPVCCGSAMAKACAQTLRDDDQLVEQDVVPAETPRASESPRSKPR